MNVIRVVEPTAEPVSRTEAKLHCRITGTDEDALVDALITSARQQAEQMLRRTLIATTLELRLDEFPAAGVIRLPWRDVSSITHVKYYDTNGTLQTLDSATYQWDATGLLLPAPTYSWPGTQPARLGAVQVRYVAGWANAAAVPETIKAWIKVRISTLYERRDEVVVGAAVADLGHVDRLLDRWRVVEM